VIKAEDETEDFVITTFLGFAPFAFASATGLRKGSVLKVGPLGGSLRQHNAIAQARDGLGC